MITTVEMGNFLAHTSTKLDFDEGVTVFVGHNGAGKSSVIDAITFALFGQHTRKSNKGLIHRGTNQGFVKVDFTINNKSFEAVRKIDSKGTLSSKFLEKQDDKWVPLAVGERKQFGESMTKEIESRIGLDFEKLKVASIVQQGELNSIIKAKPKEFKELLNAIIGIDKLDKASELMKTIQKNFRESMQTKLGYDDTHIEILKKEISELETQVKQTEPQKKKLTIQKKKLEEELSQLQDKLEKDFPKEGKLKELEARKTDLIKYAREAILSIQKEIDENERKIKDCETCFEFVEAKNETENHLKEVESEIESLTSRIQDCHLQIVKLKEQEDLASKLELKNGKCPVCNSKADHLNPLFQPDHLKQEMNSINENIKKLENRKNEIQKQKITLTNKLEKAVKAETTLQAYSIKNYEELETIKEKILTQKKHIEKIPLTLSSGKLIEVSSIDSHAKILYDKIIELENETQGFNPKVFVELKNLFEQKRKELSYIDQQFGAISEKIKLGQEQIRKISIILKELDIVRQYISELGAIHNNVFNRDGSIATSLRSWALRTISEKSSEYLSMLNTKIQRISLSEKARDVTISCYSRNLVLDLESLSGGEQVSIALALRLGMAHLLGAANLNFMILDEPTTHLDEERRKSLVNVFSQLSDMTHSNFRNPLQFIIITHDSEIFEDATVEKIYKFESTGQGVQVVSF